MVVGSKAILSQLGRIERLFGPLAEGKVNPPRLEDIKLAPPRLRSTSIAPVLLDRAL